MFDTFPMGGIFALEALAGILAVALEKYKYVMSCWLRVPSLSIDDCEWDSLFTSYFLQSVADIDGVI